MSSLAKFSKYGKGDKNVVHKWVKSDLAYNHMNQNVHNTIMQKLDDEQLEGPGFVLQYIVDAISEIYKVNDIQASSNIGLPEKYKKNHSFINIINDDQLWFLGVS